MALPVDHPLAGRGGLRLADLADAGWIDASEVAAPLTELGAAAGTDRPRSTLRYQGSDLTSLLALVAAAHGLAVLPVDRLEQMSDRSQVVGVPLRAPAGAPHRVAARAPGQRRRPIAGRPLGRRGGGG